jgi:hypothetical protein
MAPLLADLLGYVPRVHAGVVEVPYPVVKVPGPVLEDEMISGQRTTPLVQRISVSATISVIQSITKTNKRRAMTEPCRSSASV